MARLTLNEIAAKAEQYAERLRTTRALREAMRIIAANIRDAAAPSPPETPAGNDVVCGDHWHGLSGEPVDGSTGCPWCHVAELQAEVARLERARDDDGRALAEVCRERDSLPPPETPAPEGSEEKRERYIDAVERVVKALAAGERPKCRTRERPAVCVGAYEESENLDFACDECCGHGNEDGWCVALASPASAPRETPADAALRDRILAHLDAASLTKARLIVEGLWPARETPRARLRFCPGGPGHRSGVNALVDVEDCPACSAPPPEAPVSAPSRGSGESAWQQEVARVALVLPEVLGYVREAVGAFRVREHGADAARLNGAANTLERQIDRLRAVVVPASSSTNPATKEQS